MPGVAEFAHPIATMEHAKQLKTALGAQPAAVAVTVVGAGPAGIETAAELAEQGRAVTLVCGGALGPSLHAKSRVYAARKLAKLGVRVLDGPGSVVTAVERDAVRLADGRALPSAITIWAAGFSVPDLALRSGLSTDALGRLLTDETLTSVDDERIVAAGDSAAPSGLPLRMSCQSAVQLGPQAAETILARLAGRTPEPIDVAFAALCVSLGRGAGIFQIQHKDDTSTSVYIGGRVGSRIKEFICRGTVWQLKTEGRKPGRHTWWKKDAKRRASVAALHGKVPGGPMNPAATDTFVAHRNLLFTVAYEMLGSAADAEDVAAGDVAAVGRASTWTQVRDQRAYLVRITTRQALNRLRTVERRREAYVGAWLPEPLLTAPDVAEDVELAESVSMAMMLVLETLSPTERAVFVLREAFDVELRRDRGGRRQEPGGRPPDRAPGPPARRRPAPARGGSQRTAQAALEAFQRALQTGDLQGLMDVLAPRRRADRATAAAIKQAALRPVIGAEKVVPLRPRRHPQDRGHGRPPS